MTVKTKEQAASQKQSASEAAGGKNHQQQRPRPIKLVTELLGSCVCNGFQFGEQRGMAPSTQLVELHGVRFIGLGALADELTPRERVYDTLEQLTTRTDRMVSVGYLLQEGSASTVSTESRETERKTRKVTETVPLDLWNQNFPHDQSMSRDVKRIIDRIRNKDYNQIAEELAKNLASQVAHLNRDNNLYLAGITAHNLAVVKVLAGRDKEAEPLFRKAIVLKDAAFGQHHYHEIALSWGELGIQLFARGDFEGALAAFNSALELERQVNMPSSNPEVAMALNNIACCNFQMGHRDDALAALLEARQIQHEAVGTSAQADLDLLHVAIVICNCGYLNLAMKRYEEARALFEEALLIQQSVLDDNHRAIRDTRSNIEFSNVFHSVD